MVLRIEGGKVNKRGKKICKISDQNKKTQNEKVVLKEWKKH